MKYRSFFDNSAYFFCLIKQFRLTYGSILSRKNVSFGPKLRPIPMMEKNCPPPKKKMD